MAIHQGYDVQIMSNTDITSLSSRSNLLSHPTAPRQTLPTLLPSPNSQPKRKRSLTHIAGIPISCFDRRPDTRAEISRRPLAACRRVRAVPTADGAQGKEGKGCRVGLGSLMRGLSFGQSVDVKESRMDMDIPDELSFEGSSGTVSHRGGRSEV